MIGSIVDREICMGGGQCTIYAPNSFDIDAELKARATNPNGDPPQTLFSAIRACPTDALSLDSDEREERV